VGHSAIVLDAAVRRQPELPFGGLPRRPHLVGR
jgi:hypothetical protein